MPTFHDPHLKFSLDIPDHWYFMPAAWSPLEQAKRSPDPEDAWVRFANKPFCCAMAHHDTEGKMQPTLQVSARPSRIPGDAEAKAALAFQLELLKDEPENFIVEQATHEANVAGHRANFIQVTSTARAEAEDVVIEIGVRNRLYQVFTPGVLLTLSLASSDDSAFYDEADFAAIIESVRVGR
ncbi:MAG: hypothetical protein C0521_10275 [Xanthomonas sp.]|nr:hypothetical protein [Xanthomonas sp.]